MTYKEKYEFYADKIGYYLFENIFSFFLKKEELNFEGIEICFIISTGRTGTKFFAEYFNQFENIFAAHEPHPDFLSIGLQFAKNEISESEIIKYLKKNRVRLLYQTSKKKANIYVESNNRLFSLIPVLEKVFPNSKFIHIVRDGRDIVRSGMSRDWFSEIDKFDRIKATDFKDDPYYDKWNRMSQFEKNCWLWQKKDNFIYQSVKDRKNSISIRFEDIFKRDSTPNTHSIIDFLGLKENKNISLKRKNKTALYKMPHWKNWTKEQKVQFDEIAGEYMKIFYDYNW